MSVINWIMQTSNAKIRWSIWLQWVLASMFGYGVGAALGNAVLNSIPPMACMQSFSDSLIERLTNFPCILPALDLALLVVILGLAGGFMQWLVLRRHIFATGLWVPASGLGFPISLIVADGVGRRLDIATPILIGVSFGVLSGILPWIVLRRKITGAGWWVLAHLLGSLVGGALGIIAFHAMGLIGFYQFTWAAAGAMFGAGLGAITGFTLVWLLRQPTAKHI